MTLPLDISKPNNPADIVITLSISGNRLVSICNALQQMLYETGRVTPAGDGWGYSSDWYQELNETVERVRDQLGEQRCAARTAS